MIRVLYNILLATLAPVAIPYWILRSRAKGHPWSTFRDAFGGVAVSEDKTAGPSVWFHAVSVGEVQSARPMLGKLRSAQPDARIFLTTGTPAGLEVARRGLADVVDSVSRAPLDAPWFVAKALRRMRPDLVIVSETEIWPNYCFEAKRHGASLMIVNARMSDRSAGRYKRFRAFFRPVLANVDLILAQSAVDRERFIAAGALPSRTVLGGNFKYDFDIDTRSIASEDLNEFIDCTEARLVLVAGSTREGEEAMLLPALRALVEREPSCLTVVAPRHPSRFDEAADTLAGLGIPLVRRSNLVNHAPDLPAILLLDTLGELSTLYGRADLVFVGGSLNGWGGHNVLEAALFGKPVVVGPTMQNFRQITNDLRGAGGLMQVENADELEVALTDLATDPDRRSEIGSAAVRLATSKRGASARAVEAAQQLINEASPRTPLGFLAACGLCLPSTLWKTFSQLRRWAYGTGQLAKRKLDRPVVSVGNLMVGGTGKTPTVAWLVESLAARGHSGSVLTRGYGRDQPHSMKLLRCGQPASSDIAGDEPAMLAARFGRTAPATVLGVGADRYQAGRAVESQAQVAYHVMDDGFQHMRLHRDLNIVLVDASNPFGNGWTLPAGRLREPLGSLRFSDVALLTRTKAGAAHASLIDQLTAINPQLRVMTSRMVTTAVVDLNTGDRLEPTDLTGERGAAFCGVGNPRSFFSQLRTTGCEPVVETAFADHHRFTDAEIDAVIREGVANRATAYVTTAKDVVRLSDTSRFPAPVYVLEIGLQVDQGEELLDRIERLLRT